MQENKKLVGYMTYEELNALVEEAKEYVRKTKDFDGVNADVIDINSLEIYDLDTFLDELERDLDYFEAQNVSWKINNARTATGISQTVSVNNERWLRRLWNYLNDEDCVPADIGICVLPARYEYAENERFLCAQIVFVENRKYTKGAGGLAFYHNRETNKCSLKVINGLCVNVTHIDTVYYAASEFASKKELWRLRTDVIPKTDAELGIYVSLVINSDKYVTLLNCLNGDNPDDSMIASMLRELEEQYAERFLVHVIKTYCPICGKDCYNRLDTWFTGGSEGCNEHAGQLAYSFQKCADLYIDYKDGKFLINNHSTHATVCKASEPVTVACAFDKWDSLKNNADIVATVKQCVDCGNAFVITKRFDSELKSHGWNQPCKCSKCRGKKEWLVLNGVWQYRI